MWNNYVPFLETKKKSEPTTWQSVVLQRYREDPERRLYQAEMRRRLLTRFYWTMIVRFGRWMVRVGSWMRERYGDVALSAQAQES
jgi:hypothetical protein